MRSRSIMNPKRLIKSLLLIFVVFSLAFLVYKEFLAKNESIANQVTKKQTGTTLIKEDPISVSKNKNLKKSATTHKNTDSSKKSVMKPQNPNVIAYYFHGKFRCTTCRTIEQYSHDAIHTYFTKELENGTLEFRPVNIEEPENRHFVQEYQLFSKALVLSLITDGEEIKWKNLTDVWKLVRDKERFFQYVKGEVEHFLNEKG
jgi:hypothetical protein